MLRKVARSYPLSANRRRAARRTSSRVELRPGVVPSGGSAVSCVASAISSKSTAVDILCRCSTVIADVNNVEKRSRDERASGNGDRSTEGTRDRRVAKAFGLEGESWLKHANPASVWTRFSVLSLLALAIWSRDWIGVWCLVPIAAAIVWMFVNPLLFKPPTSTRNWASRGVLGERIWVDRDKVELPEQFRSPATSWIANAYSIIGLGAAGLRSRRSQPARDPDRPADHPRGQGLVHRPRLAALRRHEGP